MIVLILFLFAVYLILALSSDLADISHLIVTRKSRLVGIQIQPAALRRYYTALAANTVALNMLVAAPIDVIIALTIFVIAILFTIAEAALFCALIALRRYIL